MKRNILFLTMLFSILCISCSNSQEDESIAQTLTIINTIPYDIEYSIIKGNVTVADPGNYNFQEAEYFRDINNHIIKECSIYAKEEASIDCNKEDVNITILYWIDAVREFHYAGMKNIDFSDSQTVAIPFN